MDRIKAQMEAIEKVPFNAKFGGATGNFNAHHVAYPDRQACRRVRAARARRLLHALCCTCSGVLC